MHSRRGSPEVVAAFAVRALRAERIEETTLGALAAVLQALGAPSGALLRVTRRDRAEVLHAVGAAPPPGTRVSLPDGVLQARVSHEPPQFAVRSGAHLSVLVEVDGQPWGRLQVSDERAGFDADDEELALAVAAILGAAVERARAGIRASALDELRRRISGPPDTLGIITGAVDAVTQGTDAAAGAVLRLVARLPQTVVVVHASERLDVQPGQQHDVAPELAETLRSAEQFAVPDCAADPRFKLPLLPVPTAGGACLGVGLRVEGRLWGWLVAVDDAPRPFADVETRFVVAVGALLSGALENRRQEWARAGEALLAAATARRESVHSTEVALLDRTGVIIWVNRAWRMFSDANGGDPARTGVGMSYLDLCEDAGDPVSADVAEAIRAATAGELPAPMRIVIPCHSPTAERWFDVLVSSRLDDDGICLGAAVTLSQVE